MGLHEIRVCLIANLQNKSSTTDRIYTLLENLTKNAALMGCDEMCVCCFRLAAT